MHSRVTRLARTFSRLLALLVIGCLMATLVSNIFFSDSSRRGAHISAELQNLRVINGNIEQRNKEMTQKVTAMQQDSRLLESLAREELGMIRSGETLFLFPPEFDTQFADASMR